jgi:hypothetical protein
VQVEAVQIRRKGTEDDDKAMIVVSVQDIYGIWHVLGEEMLNSNFSSNWTVGDKLDKRRL